MRMDAEVYAKSPIHAELNADHVDMRVARGLIMIFHGVWRAES